MFLHVRNSRRRTVAPLTVFILSITPGIFSMQLPPPQPSITQSLLPLANATSHLTPTPTPTAEPTYRQNQIITSSIPLYAVCNPDFSECTTKYSITEVKWCSTTTLPSPYYCEGSGEAAGCNVTECDQKVTFSSKVGERTSASTGTALVNATTTYYAAPYMEYIYPHPTAHAQHIWAKECTLHANGENVCVEKQETWDASLDRFVECDGKAAKQIGVAEEDYGYGLGLQQHEHHEHGWSKIAPADPVVENHVFTRVAHPHEPPVHVHVSTVTETKIVVHTVTVTEVQLATVTKWEESCHTKNPHHRPHHHHEHYDHGYWTYKPAPPPPPPPPPPPQPVYIQYIPENHPAPIPHPPPPPHPPVHRIHPEPVHVPHHPAPKHHHAPPPPPPAPAVIPVPVIPEARVEAPCTTSHEAPVTITGTPAPVVESKVVDIIATSSQPAPKASVAPIKEEFNLYHEPYVPPPPPPPPQEHNLYHEPPKAPEYKQEEYLPKPVYKMPPKEEEEDEDFYFDDDFEDWEDEFEDEDDDEEEFEEVDDDDDDEEFDDTDEEVIAFEEEDEVLPPSSQPKQNSNTNTHTSPTPLSTDCDGHKCPEHEYNRPVAPFQQQQGRGQKPASASSSADVEDSAEEDDEDFMAHIMSSPVGWMKRKSRSHHHRGHHTKRGTTTNNLDHHHTTPRNSDSGPDKRAKRALLTGGLIESAIPASFIATDPQSAGGGEAGAEKPRPGGASAARFRNRFYPHPPGPVMDSERGRLVGPEGVMGGTAGLVEKGKGVVGNGVGGGMVRVKRRERGGRARRERWGSG